MTTSPTDAALEVAKLAEIYAAIALANAGAALQLANTDKLLDAAQLAGASNAYGAVAKRLVALAKELT